MDDYAFALQLQEQLEQEDKDAITETQLGRVVERPLGIVDGRWELIDPTPDIRVLFQEFNKEFFWQRLASVEVRWSPRMTSCAGICVYEGRGGLCSVRLSQPLLKLRPRSDLIETLLHEMIHAYLFVTNNDRDHDGHGPEFLKHMHRINSATGAHLSVYHNFHDEVASHKQHWWRCDGRCQARPPYFGYVKRAMNRAPSDNDPWYGQHMLTCGGTFHKIKEPPGYQDKKDKKTKGKPLASKLSKGRDIRQAFQRSNKKPTSTHTQISSNTGGDSSLFPHTGYRLGSGPTTGSNRDSTIPQPSHSADSHPRPVTTIVLDTSSESDTDIDLGERMTLKRWSVSSSMMGSLNGKRRYYSSSDTDSDRYKRHHFSSLTSHKKCRVVESETGKTQDASCSQGQGHDRNATQIEVKNTDGNVCATTSDSNQVECPKCALSVTASSINQHLDECLV